MQYELRTQVIEPLRPTFQHLVDRLGDRPASRYEEGTIGLQATEHFHYRPLWDPDHELYDPDHSALKLTDPYSFTDPRQYYYAPYVTTRALMFEAFARTLDYIDDHDLFAAMAPAWRKLTTAALLPMRHYEGAAQLVSVAGARFAYGTSVEQCLSYAAFDRIGNAQTLSRIGLAMGTGATGTAGIGAELEEARRRWLEDAALQPLRRYAEEALAEPDWAVATYAIDLTDRLLYPLLYRHLDRAALAAGQTALSLSTQHLHAWYTDQRRWLDALLRAWTADPGHGPANAEALAAATRAWLPRAEQAVAALAEAADAIVPTGAHHAAGELAVHARQDLAAAGIDAGESA
ncbi:phenol 2-monooxygenase [Thermopolyspora sp. NPDC052614]|uniref:phenol 2-monooxygenase n=1 Tax=Thermopolyspora sp. NPDC052614 TaxID=3155682 RepID=UPI003425C56C